MSSPSAVASISSPTQPALQYRLRYYGFGAVVALALMLLGRSMSTVDGLAQVYLPFVGATLLVISLAGVEYHLYVQRVAAEQERQLAKREEAELQAIERQRSFNEIWQALANSRGATLPVGVLTELSKLFSADMVAVWSVDEMDSFHLTGAHPLAVDGAVRLDKVAQMSPCFEKVRESQELTRVVDFEQESTKAFAWFCEENGFKEAILSPVLVRRELVGVLAFFYRENPQLSPKLAEEMQSAANLFLCAL
jgi:transcriptional regulator with GAF, ATPase, and Fis domain